MKQAYKSRTLQSTAILGLVGVLVAGLLQLIPELAEYESEIYSILEIVLFTAALRFGVPGVLSEVVKAYKE
jgi:hypothetical protein